MKKIIFYIISVIIICTLIGILVYKTINKNKEAEILDNYVIHYYSDNFVYDIESLKDYIYVSKRNNIECIQAPCNSTKIDDFKVEYQDDYKEFIKSIFKGEKPKKINLFRKELNEDEIKIISSIVKESLEKNSLSYRILDSNIYSNQYDQKGYYLDELSDGKVIVTIASGRKNTGGYGIEISKVNVNGTKVQIYVKEYSPEPGMIVTQALTYPIVQIEFNITPEDINIKRLDNSYEFQRIK